MNVAVSVVLAGAAAVVIVWRSRVALALRRRGHWSYNERNNLVREIGVCLILGVVVPLRLLL